MNTASLALCKELYEVSRWYIPGLKAWFHDDYPENDMGDFVADGGSTSSISFICPAYDLDYLLRKLPTFKSGDSWDEDHNYSMLRTSAKGWEAFFQLHIWEDKYDAEEAVKIMTPYSNYMKPIAVVG